MKKLLSVLLLLCMLLTLLPVAALADGEVTEAPATEQTAEESAESSAERDATDTPEETEGDDAANGSADESADTSTEGEENEEAPATDEEENDSEAQTATQSMFDGEGGDETMAVSYGFFVGESLFAVWPGTPVEKNEDGVYHIPAITSVTHEVSDPTKENFVFTGWEYSGEKDADGKYIVNVDSDAEEVSVTMQAQWRQPRLELFTDGYGTVKLNGDTVGFGQTWSCTGGSTVTLTVEPMTGYAVSQVTGYAWGSGGSTAYTITPGESGTYTFTMPSCDGSLVVYFEPVNAVTLTYHDGTDSWTERVSPNENVFLLYGNWFDTDQVMVGWAIGSEDGEVASQYSYRKFTQDTHLYAKYETGVAIRYHDGVNVTTNYAAVGAPFAVTGAGAAGKTLEAWSDRALANGEGNRSGNLYYCGTQYTFNQATDLYPIYYSDSQLVTVKLYIDGIEPYQTDCVKGEEYYFPTENFFGLDGVIDYWAAGSKEGATRYSPLDTPVINSDMEFYAVMATDTVTVTLNSGDDRNLSVECDVANGKPVHTSKFYGYFSNPTGKEFVGWSTTKNGLPENEVQTFTANTTLYAVWGDEILVTYNANGGVGTFESVVGAGSYATEYKESDHVVSRTGYKLKGWATDKDGSTLYDFTNAVTADTTLYAVWEENGGGDTTATRSIFVHCNSYGSATVKVGEVEQTGSSVTAKVGDTVTIVAKPDSGYGKIVFSGADSNGITVTEGTEGSYSTYSFTVPANSGSGPSTISIALNFYPDEALTITYHYQDAEGKYTRAYAECCLPDSPVYLEGSGDMTERVIYGWAVGSADSETILTPGSFQTFKQNTELYAKYETGVKLTYHYATWDDVRYVSPKLPSYIYGVAVDETKFPVAWSTGSDGSGVRYDVGAQYIFETDTELYPIYADAADLVSVTYHYTDNGGEERSDTQWFVKGEPAWIGNSYGEGTLAYWAVGSKDSSVKYLNGEIVTLNESLELYAVMAAETVKLTYCYGDKENERSDVVVAKGSKVIIEYYPIAPLGKALVGWSREKNGAVIENNRASFDEDTTLYAVWAKEILVTFDPNGGVGGGQILPASGDKLSASDATATREGYTLKGWATDKDGGTLFDFTKPITANTTLYAVWEANGTGGDQPGGDQPGGDQPGGDQPGGDQPGGDQPGGDQPGGDQPGGDQPGGDQPGGDQPGGDQPGGDQPGGKGDEPKDDGKKDDGKKDDAGSRKDESKKDNGKTDNTKPETKSENGKKSETRAPKTGDEGHIGLWLAVLCVSAMAGVMLPRHKKRGEK